jgi:hypothetical protein
MASIHWMRKIQQILTDPNQIPIGFSHFEITKHHVIWFDLMLMLICDGDMWSTMLNDRWSMIWKPFHDSWISMIWIDVSLFRMQRWIVCWSFQSEMLVIFIWTMNIKTDMWFKCHMNRKYFEIVKCKYMYVHVGSEDFELIKILIATFWVMKREIKKSRNPDLRLLIWLVFNRFISMRFWVNGTIVVSEFKSSSRIVFEFDLIFLRYLAILYQIFSSDSTKIIERFKIDCVKKFESGKLPRNWSGSVLLGPFHDSNCCFSPFL